MFKNTIIGLVVASFLAIGANANAAMMAYLYVKGQKSGQVKGGITQKGREDSIGVIALEQTSKVGAGRLNAGQIIITKEVDKASPLLRRMLDSQENIPEATIRFWTPQIKAGTGTGSEFQHYTIRLTNARIISMKTAMDNIRHPDLVKYDVYEVIGFIYDKAEWTWMNGGINALEPSGYAQ